MKQNIPWIIIIPSVVVIILIIIVYLLTRPDDVSCPEGMYLNNSCEGGKCTWICPEDKKYSNDGCNCTCDAKQALINKDDEYLPDVDGPCTTVKADDPEVKPEDQINNECICTDNFCNNQQLQQNKSYDPVNDNCVNCKVGNDFQPPCKQENADPDSDAAEYCCANYRDCSADDGCYPPYKTFLTGAPGSYTAKACSHNTGVSVLNGNATQNCSIANPDLCCIGDEETCCREYCGLDGQTLDKHTLCSTQGDTCMIGSRDPDEDEDVGADVLCKRSEYCNKVFVTDCNNKDFTSASHCTKCDDNSYEFAACTGDVNLLNSTQHGRKCKDGMCITRLIDHLKEDENRTCNGEIIPPIDDGGYDGCGDCP